MPDPTPILAAIKACFAASPVPPTSGDLAAAVIRAVAAQTPYRGTDYRWITDRQLLDLATRLDGADD